MIFVDQAMNRIGAIKVCSCGDGVWHRIPRNAKWQVTGEFSDGAYFDCQCGSTMFVPLRDVPKQYLEAISA